VTVSALKALSFEFEILSHPKSSITHSVFPVRSANSRYEVASSRSFYFARFHTIGAAAPPPEGVGCVYFNSSPVIVTFVLF
jgi:hypothetical protein